ncbi:MAG: hypothetical protein P8076_01425 [Gammaproteobacteria bacterium]
MPIAPVAQRQHGEAAARQAAVVQIAQESLGRIGQLALAGSGDQQEIMPVAEHLPGQQRIQRDQGDPGAGPLEHLDAGPGQACRGAGLGGVGDENVRIADARVPSRLAGAAAPGDEPGDGQQDEPDGAEQVEGTAQGAAPGAFVQPMDQVAAGLEGRDGLVGHGQLPFAGRSVELDQHAAAVGPARRGQVAQVVIPGGAAQRLGDGQ